MTLCINWETFWSAITAISTFLLLVATGLLAYFGWKQLVTLNITSKEDALTNKEKFLHQLKVDFFTDNARLLLALLETHLLEFKTLEIDNDAEIGYFERLNDNTEDKKLEKLFPVDKKYFSSYEMDDFLLMHLEDLGILYEKKIVPIYDVDQLFGYYIETLFENCQVKKYIDWAKQDDTDIYSKFESLYHQLKIYLNEN